MSATSRCVSVRLCLLSFLLAAAGAGCTLVPELPESVDVSTSATTRVSASAGSGPAGLADGSWSIARKATPSDAAASASAAAVQGPYGGILEGQGLERPPAGERVFVVHFGPAGEMTRIDRRSVPDRGSAPPRLSVSKPGALDNS